MFKWRASSSTAEVMRNFLSPPFFFNMMWFLYSYCWSSKKVHRWDGSGTSEKLSQQEIILEGERVREGSAFFLPQKYAGRQRPLEGLFRKYQSVGALRWSFSQMNWALRCRLDLFLLGYKSICLPTLGSHSMLFVAQRGEMPSWPAELFTLYLVLSVWIIIRSAPSLTVLSFLRPFFPHILWKYLCH